MIAQQSRLVTTVFATVLMAFAITTRAQSATERERRGPGRGQQGERRGGPSFEIIVQRHDANHDGLVTSEDPASSP